MAFARNVMLGGEHGLTGVGPSPPQPSTVAPYVQPGVTTVNQPSVVNRGRRQASKLHTQGMGWQRECTQCACWGNMSQGYSALVPAQHPERSDGAANPKRIWRMVTAQEVWSSPQLDAWRRVDASVPWLG